MSLADQMASDVQSDQAAQQPPPNQMQPLSARMSRDVATIPPASPSVESTDTAERPLGLMTGLGEAALHLGSGAASALYEGGQNAYQRFAQGKSGQHIAVERDLLPSSIPVYQPKTIVGQKVSAGADWLGQHVDALGQWAADHLGEDVSRAIGNVSGAVDPTGAGIDMQNPENQAYVKALLHGGTMALAPKIAGEVAGPAAAGAKAAGGATADLARGFVTKEQPAPAPLNPNAAPDMPYGSVGASSASPMGRLSVASPELADSLAHQITAAKQQYGADWTKYFDANAMNAKLEADSLPVPGRLTAGEAAEDPVQISVERNNRGTATDIARFKNWQNQNMAANLKAVRDQVGPDVNTTTPTQHGQTLMDAYQARYAPRAADIHNDWAAIRASSGGAPIFDAGRMAQDAQTALQGKMLSTQDPDGLVTELTNAARRGGMTADAYQNWRQNLGTAARAGGNSGKAASAIIDATNNSELLPAATQFRGMVNDALAKGRALHAEVEADPAYDAAVNGTVSANDFVNKFLVRGKVEDIAKMSQNLGNDPVANQTMGVALIDHLRTSAGLDDQYNGNFGASNFNKQLDFIGQRAGPVFQNGELSTLQTLGDYARRANALPKGHFVSTANTAPAVAGLLSRAGSAAGGLVQAGANMAAPGLHIGSIGGELLRARSARVAAAAQELQNAKFAHSVLDPGAGIIRGAQPFDPSGQP